ncbi:MAG: MFS transporter, partial [Propioniciclava sp.]
GLFVWIESQTAQPLLPLRVLRDRTRAGAFLIQAIVGVLLIGATLFFAFQLQVVLGFSPLLAGVGNLAMTGAHLLIAPLAAQVFRRFGARAVMTSGPLIAAIGLFLMSRLTPEGTYWTDMFPGLVFAGTGMAFLFVAIQNVALTGVDEHDAGAASAGLNSAMQIGGSIGLAVMTSAFVTLGGRHAVSEQVALSGYSAVYLIAAAALLLAALLAATMIRPSNRPAGMMTTHSAETANAAE